MPTALDTTLELHQRKVYTFAYYFLHNREEAEDVTQEVLVKLWRHWPKLDPERLPAWLTRVTRNACFDLLRRRRRSGEAARTDLDEVADKAVDDRPSPEEATRSRAFQHRLTAALRELDEPYRSILILREVQGLSYQEVADAMGMPLNTVRVYIHRGRHRLRDRLREEFAHAL